MAYQTHHSIQESKQVWDQAIGRIIQQISEQQNIQCVDEAIDSLILTGGNYASPSVHALYLQKVPESKGFTRKDISKYLAELGDDSETLTTYFQLVHFGGLSILDSLRLYYTELNLEPLMNKNQLNVLLTALAEAFKANGGRFKGDIEDCVRIYNEMIMLNDSLHNKNALGRSRQTEQGFLQIINDRTQNVVKEFDEEEMRKIYQSIQRRALGQKRNAGSSLHATMHSQPITPAELAEVGGKSYSKYGKSSGEYGVIAIEMKKDYGDSDINPDDDEPKGGGCCVIL